MIVSASRRTDIPAFYGDWLLDRLSEGYVSVRNPMNPKVVSRIELSSDSIDCIVFWTKNPAALMEKLDRLNHYPYYFLFTITSYGKYLEKNLPLKEKIIDTFIKLSQKIGKEKVVWRYDPILLTGDIDRYYHYRYFAYLAGRLESYTERCIISFLDMYDKCKRNLAGFNITLPNHNEMADIAGNLSVIAGQHNIVVETCAETIDLTGVGVKPGKCIDEDLIARITGKSLAVPRDKHQRKTCRCVESVDIGAYNSCLHHCLYCYANSNREAVMQNAAQHDSRSSLLYGQISAGDKVVEREVKAYPPSQKSLF
jgi:hypothetical protein